MDQDLCGLERIKKKFTKIGRDPKRFNMIYKMFVDVKNDLKTICFQKMEGFKFRLKF